MARCDDTLKVISDLRTEGLISEYDYRKVCRRIIRLPDGAQNPGLYDFDLALVPLMWASHLIYRLYLFGQRTKGRMGIELPLPIVVKLLNLCMDSRKGVECIEMMLTSPLPFPYVHVVTLLVQFAALFRCMTVGLTLAIDPKLSALKITCELLQVTIMNSLYLGLLMFTAVIADPFGEDLVDFPAPKFHHRLWKAQHFTHTFLEADSVLDEEIHNSLQTVVTEGNTFEAGI